MELEKGAPSVKGAVGPLPGVLKGRAKGAFGEVPLSLDEILAYDFANYEEEHGRLHHVLELSQQVLQNSDYNVRYTILPLIKNLDSWLITFNINRSDFRKRLQGSLRVRVCAAEKAMDLILKLQAEIEIAQEQMEAEFAKMEVETEAALEGKRQLASRVDVEIQQLTALIDLFDKLQVELILPRETMSFFYNWFALLIYVVPSSYKSLNSNLRVQNINRLKRGV